MDASHSNPLLERLTSKKREYLQDSIVDKNGEYNYLEDPQEYKKARKRLQNRESAVRSRQRKKCYQEVLEAQIDEQKQQIEELVRANEELKMRNSTLTDANCQLKEQMQYYAPYIGQMSDMVEQYKLSILKKISPRDN